MEELVTTQKVYNMVFLKILEKRRISELELIEFVRESITADEYRNTQLSYVFDLISKNPNITTAPINEGMLSEYIWCGPILRFLGESSIKEILGESGIDEKTKDLPTLDEYLESLYTEIAEKYYSKPLFKCPKCNGPVRKDLYKAFVSVPPKRRYECDNCKHVITL